MQGLEKHAGRSPHVHYPSGKAYRLYVLWLLFFVYVIHHLDRNILLLLQERSAKSSH